MNKDSLITTPLPSYLLSVDTAKAATLARKARTKQQLAELVVKLENKVASLQAGDVFVTKCGGWCGETNVHDSKEELEEHLREELDDNGHDADDITVYRAREITFSSKRTIELED